MKEVKEIKDLIKTIKMMIEDKDLIEEKINNKNKNHKFRILRYKIKILFMFPILIGTPPNYLQENILSILATFNKLKLLRMKKENQKDLGISNLNLLVNLLIKETVDKALEALGTTLDDRNIKV